MLNYKSLSLKFTERLKTFNAEKIEQWMAFDRERDVVSQALKGEKVQVCTKSITIVQLSDPTESINSAPDHQWCIAA